MNNSAQCCACLTETIASTPAGQACLDNLTDGENRHLAEHFPRQAEGDLAPEQEKWSSSSKDQRALEAVPPTSKLLPLNPSEEMTATLDVPEQPDGSAPRQAVPEPTELSRPPPPGVSTLDPGAMDGDIDLDLILRQDKRDLRAAMAVFRRKERTEVRSRYGDMM